MQEKEKLSASYETLSYPAVLQGVRVTAREKQYITDFDNSLTSYFKNNPEGSVVNLSGDGLWPSLYDHMTNIRPLYLYAAQFMWAVYPDFLPRTLTYIATNHPLVVTDPTSISSGGLLSR